MDPCTRRQFIQRSATATLGLGLLPTVLTESTPAYPRPEKNAISLATWSIVGSFRAQVWKLTDVARICREDFGVDGIEYVTSFFEVPVESYLRELNQAAAKYGVKNVLIMVDDEGNMVAKDKNVRDQAAINHRKWIEIAAYLGCHAIRCNAGGGGQTPEQDPDALDRAAEAFSSLLDYAKEFKINVLIENHGGMSSYPHWLPELMKKVNSPHFGILPDYGNYRTKEADVYEAVRLAMPYAKGVSVKAQWLADGTNPQYDLEKLLTISKESGYTGFWGIESSMRRQRSDRSPSAEDIKKNEWQAVLWTKAVIEKIIFGKT
jgi:sugar phosphate isomerase/epimerase